MEQPDDPLRTCAYSGVERPESQMVKIGDHYVSIESKDEAIQYLQQGNDLAARLHSGMRPTSPQLTPLLSRSWELTVRHAGLLIAIFLSINLPMSLLESYWTHDLEKMVEQSVVREGRLPSSFWLMLLIPMATAMFSSFGTAAILAALSRSWAGMQPDFLEAWLATAKRMWPLSITILATFLLVLVGFALCVLPGIFLLVKLTFCFCFVMDGRVGGLNSIERSIRLTEGRFWPVLGFMILVTVMTAAPSGMLMSILGVVPWVRDSWALTGFFQAVLTVPMIFLVVFTFAYYKALLEATTGSRPAVAL